jgi:asparagine synthase (glutamine-hydrolysing)
MSAIAGVVRFDGAPPEPARVERMTAAMRARGPDGIAHRAGAQAAFGHCALRSTPESLAETQPHASADGNTWLVMDGCMDNREELARDLAARGITPRDPGDPELLLCAYAAWGAGCAERVIGELAFVIWDGRERRLFAARDAAGARHFYYARGEGWFAFASEIGGLLASGLVARQLNEARFVENLVIEFDREDQVGTCYAGIDRLPAGHAMRVDARGASTWRYWDPRNLEGARYGSGGECAEAYLEVLRKVIAPRMRHVGTMGAALSGGLDSSSIAALVARDHGGRLSAPLATFTLVHDDRARCPEWASVSHLVAQGGLAPTVIGPEVAAQVQARCVQSMRGFDEPFSFNNGYTDLLVCDAAQASGCRVLLDGMAGDLAFYWFDESLSFRPRHLPHLPGLLAAALRHRTPGVARMLALRSAAAATPKPLRALYRKIKGTPLPNDAQLLRREIALDLVQRRRRREPALVDDRAAHAALFTTGLLSMPHEGYGQIALARGIEPRSPFSDRRMIEFAVRLPREAKITSGWFKRLAREALGGILPEPVRWRRDATMHPGWQFRSRLARELAQGAQGVWNRREVGDRMKRWVDRGSLERAWSEWQGRGAWSQELITLVAYAQWLDSPRGNWVPQEA